MKTSTIPLILLSDSLEIPKSRTIFLILIQRGYKEVQGSVSFFSFEYCQAQFQQEVAVAIEQLRWSYNHLLTNAIWQVLPSHEIFFAAGCVFADFAITVISYPVIKIL